MEYINESTIGIAMGIVTTLAGTFKLLNLVRKRNVANAVFHAYHIVNDIASADESVNGLDKTAEALRQVDKWMASNGWRPLKSNEQEFAQLAWKSMHGSEAFPLKRKSPVNP